MASAARGAECGEADTRANPAASSRPSRSGPPQRNRQHSQTARIVPRDRVRSERTSRVGHQRPRSAREEGYEIEHQHRSGRTRTQLASSRVSTPPWRAAARTVPAGGHDHVDALRTLRPSSASASARHFVEERHAGSRWRRGRLFLGPRSGRDQAAARSERDIVARWASGASFHGGLRRDAFEWSIGAPEVVPKAAQSALRSSREGLASTGRARAERGRGRHDRQIAGQRPGTSRWRRWDVGDRGSVKTPLPKRWTDWSQALGLIVTLRPLRTISRPP